ncbi:MAG: CDP-alcohol phosphatidyltransferase family protein [Pirellulaceae bacterium]
MISRENFDAVRIMDLEVSGRRPLKSRNMPVFQRLAAWLAGTSITPNMISTASMGMALIAGVSLAATSVATDDWWRRGLWLLAAIGIQGRLIANLLDGMVAVEGGKSSPVGDLYNEVPDRVSDTLILVGAGLSATGNLYLGLSASLLAVFVAYVRAIGASVGAGQVFAGPLAKPQRMALMTLACVTSAMLPTRLQTMPVGAELGLMTCVLGIIIAGCVITSIRRLRKIAESLRKAAVAGEV